MNEQFLTKEAMNEISERLPGALAIAANALGLTVAELQQALERKEIRADDSLRSLSLRSRKRDSVSNASLRIKAAVAKPVVQGQG